MSFNMIQYGAASIHVRIDDILRPKSLNEFKEWPINSIDIARTCLSNNIGKTFILTISPSRRTFINTKNINNKLKQLCQGNNFAFPDNFQITSNGLWEDGTHLVEVGKVSLASNFVDNFNYFLRNT